MPMFANTNGVLIQVFALLHWSLAHGKLIVAPSQATHPSTTESYRTTWPMDSNTTIAAFSDTAPVAAAPAAVTEEDEYSYRDSRYLQGTTNNNDMYRWRGITQPQQQQQQQHQTVYNDYAYSADYAETSPAAVEPPSSHGYPYLTTTQKPVLRHLKFRPRITKLEVKAVRRGPNGGIKDMFVDNDSFEEPDTDFLPLVTLYGSQISRWSTMPTNHVSQYTYGSTQPGKTYPSSPSSFGSSSTGAATSFGHSGLSFSAGSGSALEDLHHSASHHHVPIYSAHAHHMHHTPKFDMKKLGILALVKIGLAKLKAFGILKLIFLLLLKLKLFLLAMFIKFVLFLKLLKVLKSLLVPLIILAALIPLLLALLALPILLAGLAPALYSLLTMLPIIPIVNFRPPKARVQMNKDQEADAASDTMSTVFDQLLNSTQCIEKIACQLATKKEATLFFPFINWYLHKVSDWLQNDKISTYVSVYTKTVKEYKGKNSDEDGEQWCSAKYYCEKSEDDTSKELKQTPDRRAFSKILDPPRNYTG